MVPVITRVSAEIPLKAASDSVVTPFAAAIPESVSPSSTVWAPAVVAVVVLVVVAVVPTSVALGTWIVVR